MPASTWSTSPTVRPSIWTSLIPLTDGRSTGGILTVAIGAKPIGPALAGRGAQRLVVLELGRLEVDAVAADRAAFGVAPDLQLGELGGQRLEEQQPADERLALADDQLDRLVRLEQAHDPRQHAEHAVRATRGRQVGRRRLRVEAAVAR